MARKKKADEKPTITSIYDEEAPIKALFNPRPKIVRPFRSGKDWYCSREACKNEGAMLINVGNELFICGHCYDKHHLKE